MCAAAGRRFGAVPPGMRVIHRARNAEALNSNWCNGIGHRWTRRTKGQRADRAPPRRRVAALQAGGQFDVLEAGVRPRWHGHRQQRLLRAVAGRGPNGPARYRSLPLSPPGSAHLRGLTLSNSQLTALGAAGKSVHLFRATTRCRVRHGVTSRPPRPPACTWLQVPGAHPWYGCRCWRPGPAADLYERRHPAAGHQPGPGTSSQLGARGVPAPGAGRPGE
jgi:hypothetical protein